MGTPSKVSKSAFELVRTPWALVRTKFGPRDLEAHGCTRSRYRIPDIILRGGDLRDDLSNDVSGIPVSVDLARVQRP